MSFHFLFPNKIVAGSEASRKPEVLDSQRSRTSSYKQRTVLQSNF